MGKRTVWISYDLGVRGDYEGLFTWLDSRNAKECGPNLALISIENSNDIVASIKQELSNALQTDKRTRIYVIHRSKETKLMKGAFVFGGRRSAPWTGFATREGEIDSDEGA